MLDLGFWTTLVTLFALAAAEWLGFYIVTRSPRSLVSWLTAFVLWALGAYFFYTALAVNETVGSGYAWTQQVVIIVAPLWFHISVLLTRQRGVPDTTRWQTFNRIAVPCMYLYTVSLIAIGLFSRLVVIPVSTNSVNYRNAPGPLYPLVILLFFLALVPSMLNLFHARRSARDPNLQARYSALIAATVLTVLGGVYLATNLLLGTGLPAIVGDLFLTAGVLLMGFAVARFSAFLEGRSMNRDFLYTLLVVGALTLFYAMIVFVLYLGERLSFLALALTVVGMVAANSLFDGVRLTLDRIFYKGSFRELRANLRALSREAGTSQTVDRRLHAILATMCNALQISGGFIAVRRGDKYVINATQDALPPEHSFALDTLDTREMIGLTVPTRKGLQGMTLLIPLQAEGEQIGAVVLGARAQNEPYEEHDFELLEDLADQIARLLHEIGKQQMHAQELNNLVVTYREREHALELQVQQLLAEQKSAPAPLRVGAWNESQFTGLVEDGLRHIHDYPYLGEHALSNLRCVQIALQNRASSTAPILLDRGKAVSEQLLGLLDTLKPNAPAPKSNQVPSREWHLYMVLYDSYVLEETNREVMSKLYISEGTFSRTRRRAIHAMAKALAEVEERNATPSRI